MPSIHSSAQVDPLARLGDVRIGPFCVVGPDVSLGDGVVLHSHVVVAGRTEIGAGTVVFPFASLGHRPQDLKFRDERTSLTIGPDCAIREGVTINPGTQGGGLETVIGARCTLMAQAHVGHDCRLGDDVVLSNNVMLAGHVTIGDHAILGGGVGVHQFVRIGEMAFVGGLSGLEGDLIPYGLAIGNRARLGGLNLVGLRRHAVARSSIAMLSDAFEALFRSDGPLADRIEGAASQCGHDPFVANVMAFLSERGRRPLCQPETPVGARGETPVGARGETPVRARGETP